MVILMYVCSIIKALIKHAKDVKRVAPYLLVFVINLYTSNERPATLYPKVYNCNQVTLRRYRLKFNIFSVTDKNVY